MAQLTYLIHQYKTDPSFDFQLILSKMTPLLKKYSNKFSPTIREDAFQEFSIALLDCTKSIQNYSSEQQCLTYFRNAILNKYMYLKKLYYIKESDNLDDLIDFSNCTNQDIEFTAHIRSTLKEFYKSLPVWKKKVFTYILQGYSCAEIAKKLNVTRQYIHVIRKELRDSLKNYL